MTSVASPAFEAAKAHHKAGDLTRAEQLYRVELETRPSNDDCLHRLGILVYQRGDAVGSVSLIQKAIALNDREPSYHNHLGAILQASGRVDDARVCFERALELAPNLAEAHNNLGTLLLATGATKDALPHLTRAQELSSQTPEIAFNLGNVRRALDQPDTAMAAYRRAILLKPDYAEAHVNLGFLLLAAGRFAEGGEEYDWRWRLRPPPSPLRSFSQPQWQGEAVPGATVLVHAEQGLGDTIQFCRFLEAAAERCGHLLFEVPPALKRLLAPMAQVATLIAKGEPLPEFDLHCPLLSLPWRLGVTRDRLTVGGAYLSAEPERIEAWRGRLGPAAIDFRVGIAWQGNPKARHDSGRSIPLPALLPLASVPGVKLFSLQKGYPDDPAQAASDVVSLGSHFDSGPDAFIDCAAVMENLDLVVTSDTAIAHLAGALGAPVWLLLAKAPDWRWRLGDGDVWYPTMRLYRQRRNGDWDEPVARVMEDLRRAGKRQQF